MDFDYELLKSKYRNYERYFFVFFVFRKKAVIVIVKIRSYRHMSFVESYFQKTSSSSVDTFSALRVKWAESKTA